jgi:hypothetical protein
MASEKRMNLTFEEYMNAQPKPQDDDQMDSNNFAIRLFYHGRELGWLEIDTSGWATVSPNPTNFTPYNHAGDVRTYYRCGDRYLSHYDAYNHDVGLYQWASAVGWRLKDMGDGTRQLVSEYNGQSLSIKDTNDHYLHTQNDFLILNVEIVWT